MAKIMFLFSFIVFNILQASAHKCFFTWKVEVFVVNNLPSNSASLKLHCASKDDDLGNHMLKTNQYFHWTFCENFFPNTLFFCHLWWGSKQRTFDAFKSKWKQKYSGHDYWVVKSDGIYFSFFNSTKDFIKKYDWN
ncbi:hypothetical protein Pfo_027182 [Paulownia fortunei]|nr:hypothetical protein Pfo_027182 [Paulownia fortunei]